MKTNLLQKIVDTIDDVTGLTGGTLLYSPDLDLNAQTKPFAVVRSLTDMEKIVTFDAAKETEYYIWVYVYPIPNEYQAMSLPEDVKTTLFSELTVTIGTAPSQTTYKSKPLSITINRLNGLNNDLERYGSVINCIYKIYS